MAGELVVRDDGTIGIDSDGRALVFDADGKCATCCGAGDALRYRAVYNCWRNAWEMYGEPVAASAPQDDGDRNKWLRWTTDCHAAYYQVPADEDNPPALGPYAGFRRADCCERCADGYGPMPIDPTRLYCFQHTVVYPASGNPPSIRAQDRQCMPGWTVGGSVCVGCHAQWTIWWGEKTLVVLNAARVTGDCDFAGQFCGPVEWPIPDCWIDNPEAGP